MNDLLRRTSLAVLIGGGALFVAACGGDRADEAATNDLDTNIMFEEPANDQSALESTANVTDLTPVANEAGSEENEVEETDNGMVESNVAGM